METFSKALQYYIILQRVSNENIFIKKSLKLLLPIRRLGEKYVSDNLSSKKNSETYLL